MKSPQIVDESTSVIALEYFFLVRVGWCWLSGLWRREVKIGGTEPRLALATRPHGVGSGFHFTCACSISIHGDPLIALRGAWSYCAAYEDDDNPLLHPRVKSALENLKANRGSIN